MLVNPTVVWLAPLFRLDKPVLQVPSRPKLPKNEPRKRNFMPDFPFSYDILLLELILLARRKTFFSDLHVKQKEKARYNVNVILYYKHGSPYTMSLHQDATWQVCVTNPLSRTLWFLNSHKHPCTEKSLDSNRNVSFKLLARTRKYSSTNSEVMFTSRYKHRYWFKTQAWGLNLMRKRKQMDTLAGHKTKQRHRWRLDAS